MHSFIYILNKINLSTVFTIFFSTILVANALFSLKFWSGITSSILRYFFQNKIYMLLFIVLLVFSIVAIDYPVSLICKQHNYNFLKVVTELISKLSEGWFILALLTLIISLAYFFKKYELMILYRISFASCLYAGTINFFLKGFFARERPIINLNQLHFFHFFLTHDNNFSRIFYNYNSMPSGHTIAITSALIPLFLYYRHLYYRIVLVLIYLSVVFARIYSLNHWLSDTLLATFLGMVIAISCYKVNLFRFNNANKIY